MTVVIVKVGKQKDLKGTFAAKQFWPEGTTKRDISEDHLAMLQRTRAPLTVVAIGDEAVALYEDSEERRVLAKTKKPTPHVKGSTPNPGQPGSPSRPLGGTKSNRGTEKEDDEPAGAGDATSDKDAPKPGSAPKPNKS